MPFLSTDVDEVERQTAMKINNKVLKEFFNGEGDPHQVVSEYVDNYLKEYKEDRYEYYMSEPIVSDDAKGVGPFLMAYSEMLRLEKTE